MGGDEKDRPFFPPPRAGSAYRRAESVARVEDPPKQTEVHLAEPPPSRIADRAQSRAALGSTGLSVEQRIARDMALHDEEATDVAKRVGWNLAFRIIGVVVLLVVAGVISLLPRPASTFIVAALGILGGVAGVVWRIHRALRQTRDREGSW